MPQFRENVQIDLLEFLWEVNLSLQLKHEYRLKFCFHVLISYC